VSGDAEDVDHPGTDLHDELVCTGGVVDDRGVVDSVA